MKRALILGTLVVVALAAWFVWRGDGAEPERGPPDLVPHATKRPAPPALPKQPDAGQVDPSLALAQDVEPTTGGADASEIATVEVTVTDAEGRALAGAEVLARAGERLQTKTTGADGTAVLVLEPGGWRVVAGARGFVPASVVEKLRPNETTRRTFALAPAAAIRGIVVTREGVPVANAKIDAAWRQSDDVPKRTAVTATDGTFALDGVDRGARVVIRVTTEVHPQEEAAVTAPDERVRIVLRTGLQVRVRVKEANGQPAAGCIASLFRAGTAMYPGQYRALSWQRDSTWKETDANGVALFQGVVPGALVAYARREPADGGDDGPFGSAKATATAPLTEIEIRLAAGHRLSGRVTDDEGAPIERAGVSIRKDDPLGYAVTAADGTFATRLYEPPPWQLSVEAPGHEPARPETSGPTIAIVLKRLAALTGRVLDPSGAPIPKFTVNDVEVAAPDGRFAVPLRSPSRHPTIEVEAVGFSPVTLTNDEKLDFGDVVLQRGRSVKVTVVDAATQKPIANAAVRPPGSFSASMLDDRPVANLPVTGADGTVTMADVGDGAMVQVRHPDYVTAEATVPAGASTLRVALEPGGVLRVRVTGARTTVIDLQRYPTGRQTMFLLGREGTFRVVPARYALRLLGTRPAEQAREVQVVAGRETEVVFAEAEGSPCIVQTVPPTSGAALVVAGDVPAPAHAVDWAWLTTIAARASIIDGSAAFPAMPAGRVTIFFERYPHYHRVVGDTAGGKITVTLPPALTMIPKE